MGRIHDCSQLSETIAHIWDCRRLFLILNWLNCEKKIDSYGFVSKYHDLQ